MYIHYTVDRDTDTAAQSRLAGVLRSGKVAPVTGTTFGGGGQEGAPP